MNKNRTNIQIRERLLIMSGAMLTLLLAALDNTIVSTAMPKIVKDLNGIEHYSWPFTSYLLFSTIILPISGKLADIYGRKRITISGIIFFIIASALCGLSSNMIMLSVFRGLQGIGGGICVSSAFVIVAEIFPPRERGKYMGLLASMFAVSSILGPGAGGFIADKLSWHWIFYINIPLGIVAFLLIYCNLHPVKHHEEKRRIDYPGVGAFVLFVAPFLFAVTEAGKRPIYSLDILALFCLSIVAFAVFISIEKKSKEPLLSLHFFKEKVFASSVVSSSLGNMAIFGAAIFLPLYLQSAKGKSATESGMIMMPMMVLMILSSNISGRILTHRYLFKFMASIGLFMAFTGMLCIGLFGAEAGINYIILFSGFAGFGIGLTFPVYNAAPQSLFPLKQVGLVTSLLQFFRNMGGTVGSAFLGAIMSYKMNAEMKTMSIPGVSRELADLMRNPKILSDPEKLAAIRENVPVENISQFDLAIKAAFNGMAASIERIFLVSAIILFISLIVTLLYFNESDVRRSISEYRNNNS